MVPVMEFIMVHRNDMRYVERDEWTPVWRGTEQ